MKLTYDSLSIALSEPWVTHKVATNRLNHLLVEIAWEGMLGRGVAVPSKEHTTRAHVCASLDLYAPILEGRSPWDIEALVSKMAAAAPGQSAALAAVDMALHDLMAQAAGLPLCELLGLGGLPAPPSAVSLGITSPSEAAARAEALREWPIVKLKMSAPDEALVRQVREAYAGRLWIDANGAWGPKQALAAAETFHRLGVELIEQPTAPGALADLRFVRERSPALIVADEDCIGPEDVTRLAGCADIVNIKLLKCGGIRRAQKAIERARAAGLRVMLGCKAESSLGVTAMAHLGGLADLLDLDGHLGLLDDPFEGVTLTRGVVTLPIRPGLGVVRRSSPGVGTAARP